MPRFEFTITAPATQSARVSIEAETIEEAQAIALAPSFYEDPDNAKFEIDEGNPIHEVYLPDEDDYEEIPTDEDDVGRVVAGPAR
ncbi:hypothetical protein [Rhizobium leguminosarum]|uniref:hypothetical protein n=1 Tax=Rhizobium leguminosarum TaxID=384 RepID=UPI002E1426BE|nr:hypothetical protein U8Q02_38390 [Rhizobium leguminosarum]